MAYDILKNLGLDHLDARSPDFLKTLQRLQKEAWRSLQNGDAAGAAPREESEERYWNF